MRFVCAWIYMGAIELKSCVNSILLVFFHIFFCSCHSASKNVYFYYYGSKNEQHS